MAQINFLKCSIIYVDSASFEHDLDLQTKARSMLVEAIALSIVHIFRGILHINLFLKIISQLIEQII